MADPATTGGGASSHLQSQLAANTGGGGGKVGGISQLLGINGANFNGAATGLGGALGLNVIGNWLSSAVGMNTAVGGDKLSKKAFISMFSKNAKAMGASNTQVAAGSPTLTPPSLATPQAPGGQGPQIG